LAGRQAIFQTAGSRVFLPFPAIFLPAIAGSLLQMAKLWPKGNTMGKVLEIGLCTFSITVALPASIALFNDKCCVPAESLEQEFQ